MKQFLTTLTVMMALAFAGASAAADTVCTAKAGTWEVTYEDGTKTTWTLTESPPSVYVFECQLDGQASGDAYTGSFEIVLLTIDNNYHYTEVFPITQNCETTKLLFSDDNRSFTVVAGGGYPIKSGKKIAGSDGGCPAAAALDNDAEKLDTLRRFRDGFLDRSLVGRKLISVYYAHGGRVTALMEESPSLRRAARALIEALLPVIERCAGQ